MRIKGFYHVAVDSLDTERSRAFYEALGGKVILSLPRTEDGGMNYHLEIAPGAVIEIQPPRSGVPGEPAGWGHVALETDNCREACEIAEAAGGVVSKWPMDKVMVHTGGQIPFRNAIVFGPDGEKIELIEILPSPPTGIEQ